MTNESALNLLRQLRADLAAGVVTVDIAAETFERLVWSLPGTSRADERELNDRVNDVETIRFTRLLENQPEAVDEVFGAAERVFERCGG